MPDKTDETTGRAETVDGLARSVATLEETVAELEEDLHAIRTALGESDGDAPTDAAAGDGVTVDASVVRRLQHTVDSVEENVSNRIERLWSEIDDLNDDLVELSATVQDLPEMEDRVESVADSVTDLTDETDDVRRSLSELRDDLETLETRVATGEEVRSVEHDVERVAGDLDTLRTAFEDVDRADPEAVREVQQTLDALRNTVVDQGKRIETLQQTASSHDDRIERVFRNSAKTEALSSLETEISRVRQTASTATETATEAKERVESLERRVAELDDDLSALRTNVDAFAGITPTESEMNEAVRGVEDRLDALEGDVDFEGSELREQVDQLMADRAADSGGLPDDAVFAFLAVGLASVGVLGAVLAASLGSAPVAVGFVVLVTLPGVLQWLAATGRLDGVTGRDQ